MAHKFSPLFTRITCEYCGKEEIDVYSMYCDKEWEHKQVHFYTASQIETLDNENLGEYYDTYATRELSTWAADYDEWVAGCGLLGP